MAPEQLRGAPADARSDQFSFCVALFEALTGKRPFVGKTVEQLRSAMAAALVMPRLGARTPRVELRLRALLARGLSAQPEARYPSMRALLDDFDALLASPLAARLAWAAAVAVPLALVGGWRLSRPQPCDSAQALVRAAWGPSAQARAEAAFLATSLPFAQGAWQQTRAALDAWAAQWVEGRTEACTATSVRGEQTERQRSLRFECYEHHLDEVAALTAAFAEADAELVIAAPSALARLTPLSRCARLSQLEGRRAPPPEKAEAARVLAQQLAQARALFLAGRLDAAREKLQSLSAQASLEHLPALESEAFEALGELETRAFQLPQAREAFEKALRAAEVARDDASAARVLARMVSLVGSGLERPVEARAWASLASGIVERIAGDTLTEAYLEEGLGDTEWQDGHYRAALAAYQASLAHFSSAVGAQSLDAARLHCAIGWVLLEPGALGPARVALERCLALRQQLLGPQHPMLAESYNALSALEDELRDSAASLRATEAAVAVTRVSAVHHRRMQLMLADALLGVRRAPEALALLEELQPTLPDARDVAFWVSHTRALHQLGRTAEALREGRAFLAETEERIGKEHPVTATVANSLAEVTAASGLWSETLALTERFLAVKASLEGVDTPSTGETLLLAAQAQLALGQVEQALPRAERALAALERGTLSVQEHGEARRVLAEALLRTGKQPARARTLREEALQDAEAAEDAALRARVLKLGAVKP